MATLALNRRITFAPSSPYYTWTQPPPIVSMIFYQHDVAYQVVQVTETTVFYKLLTIDKTKRMSRMEWAQGVRELLPESVFNSCLV